MKKRNFYWLKSVLFTFFIVAQNSLFAQQNQSDIAYEKADSVAMLYPNHSLSDLKRLSKKLTEPFSTEHEKFRAIYRWICENIENDYGFYAQNKRKREKLKDDPEALKQWNRELSSKVLKRLLEQRKTVCTGYAYLLRDMALYAGIECEIVNGYGRNATTNLGAGGVPNHSWNVVKLDGNWYLCDATWASGAIYLNEKSFRKNYSEGYFLAPPALFVRSHYPLDSTWLLMENPPTLSEFFDGPLVYKGAFNQGINAVKPSSFTIEVKKGEKTTFQFETFDSKEPTSFQFEINKGSYQELYVPELSEVSENNYSFSHVFTRKGLFVVNLLAGGEHLATYRVQVQK